VHVVENQFSLIFPFVLIIRLFDCVVLYLFLVSLILLDPLVSYLPALTLEQSVIWSVFAACVCYCLYKYGVYANKSKKYFLPVQILGGLTVALFTFCAMEIDRGQIETNSRFILYMLCVMGACICFANREWTSVVEFLLIGSVGYLFKIDCFTFSVYSMTKMLCCVVTFVGELLVLSSKMKTGKLKYSNTCSSKKMFDEGSTTPVYLSCVDLNLRISTDVLKDHLCKINSHQTWRDAACTILSSYKYMTYAVTMHSRDPAWYILIMGFATFIVFRDGVKTNYYMEILFISWTIIEMLISSLELSLDDKQIPMNNSVDMYSSVKYTILIIGLTVSYFVVPLDNFRIVRTFSFTSFIVVGFFCNSILIFLFWLMKTTKSRFKNVRKRQ
jgi:hypothetical protein